MTWTTPIRLAPDAMWCVWHDMWSGYFEFICGRKRAEELLNGGMTKINGRPCQLEVVGEWPELDALQIRASIPSGNPEARYDWELEGAAA